MLLQGEDYAELDVDGNKQISLREMIHYEVERRRPNTALTVAIFWIGFMLDDTNKNVLEEVGLPYLSD